MKKTKLLIVSHPDDEAIFFGGLVQRFAKDFHIVCATNGDADKRGRERRVEFEKSCQALGVDSYEMWDFPDIYEKRLQEDQLVEKVKAFAGKNVCEVYTHNPIGEYGHPHHQDVSAAVYKAFEDTQILSPAYNCYPSEVVQLTKTEYDTKAKILTEIYGKETQRFLNILPIGHIEGFSEISHAEAGEIYDFVTKRSKQLKSLHCFAHLEEFIKTRLVDQDRLF